MPSVTCLRPMSALSAIFSFQFSLLFFHVGSTAAYVVYPISDILAVLIRYRRVTDGRTLDNRIYLASTAWRM